MVVFLTFRRQLLKLAPWLRELEVGNVRVKFGEELAKATDAAEAIPAPNTPAALPPSVTDNDLLLAEHAPIGLILQSWLSVEKALADAAMRHALPASSSPGSLRAQPPSFRLIQELQERHLITDATAKTLRYLRDLRNQVAHHKGSVATEEALEYARLAKKVIGALGEDRANPPVSLP
jgi:hypothetical protein